MTKAIELVAFPKVFNPILVEYKYIPSKESWSWESYIPNLFKKVQYENYTIYFIHLK